MKFYLTMRTLGAPLRADGAPDHLDSGTNVNCKDARPKDIYLLFLRLSFEADWCLDAGQPCHTNRRDSNENKTYSNCHKDARGEKLVFLKNRCIVVDGGTAFENVSFSKL